MPTILVTNDDGVYSPGLLALAQGLRQLGEVMILAPERNWSASSHSKTMHKPLRIQRVALADGSEAYMSSGSPTDCVALVAGGALETLPDVVVSGINAGYNLGIDITYSGTVACAMEATIKGLPGIAVSTIAPFAAGAAELDQVALLAKTAQIACEVTAEVLKQGLPANTLLNVNVPGVAPEEIRGIHITRMGKRHYASAELLERLDPYGRPYYWLGGSEPVDVYDDGTDVSAVKHGYVSVTPVSLDLTDYAMLDTLKTWALAAPAATG